MWVLAGIGGVFFGALFGVCIMAIITVERDNDEDGRKNDNYRNLVKRQWLSENKRGQTGHR